jgi:hypothetical protein
MHRYPERLVVSNNSCSPSLSAKRRPFAAGTRRNTCTSTAGNIFFLFQGIYYYLNGSKLFFVILCKFGSESPNISKSRKKEIFVEKKTGNVECVTEDDFFLLKNHQLCRISSFQQTAAIFPSP